MMEQIGGGRIMMKCDFCNKPAVVHEVTVRNGVKREIHLCEDHAAEAGVNMPGEQPINQLLTQFVISQSESGAQSPAERRKSSRQRRTCSECGLSYEQFRRKGVLGCPQCYESFEESLGPLIERTQNGATHHVGKAPKRAGQSIDRQLERRRLIKELDDAVSAEQYERAAKIRDRLHMLEAETNGREQARELEE
jgi:protein arginine kinase activator